MVYSIHRRSAILVLLVLSENFSASTLYTQKVHMRAGFQVM